ncbi:hypothetical protein P2318_31370 [Myxococcaceae bacterium GXIMD 01537]
MKSLKLSAPMMLLAAAAVLATGCAASKRESYMFDKAHEHVYRVPVAELWPHAMGLVKDKGYSLREDKGGFEAQTEWLQTSAASSLGTSFQRYLVRGRERGPGLSSVEFIKMVRNEARGADNMDENGGRGSKLADTQASSQMQPDLEMEWELLLRVDAAAAEQYKGEALQKFQ